MIKEIKKNRELSEYRKIISELDVDGDDETRYRYFFHKGTKTVLFSLRNETNKLTIHKRNMFNLFGISISLEYMGECMWEKYIINEVVIL